MKKEHLHIRWMIRNDLDACLRDNNHWLEQDYLAGLKIRNVIGMVCEHWQNGYEDVIGHMIYELFPKHLYVKLLASGHTHMRKEVTQAFGRKLISKLTAGRRVMVFVECRYDQTDECKWLAEIGFRGAPFTNDEGQDVILMKYYLPIINDEVLSGVQSQVESGEIEVDELFEME